MATVTLGSKAEGSIIKLKENGVLVDFCIANQNYERGLNGAGRVLVVRKDCYGQSQWNSSNVNAYATSTIDTWLNGTYKNLLDADIRAAMGTTKIYYTPGNGDWNVTILERSVFLLSATELGLADAYMKTEGTALSSTVLNLIKYGDKWTRSPGTYGTDSAWSFTSYGRLEEYYCSVTHGIYPVFTLPSTLYVSDDGSVSVNTAPGTPASITIPDGAEGGNNITVTWTASTDAENNLEGYIVERSTDGGNAWTQVFQGGGLTATFVVPAGSETVMCRVKAYDSEGLYSGYRNSAQVSVFNNNAPGAPASITIPENVLGGGTLALTWGAATDADNNLSGYELERQVDGGEWAQVYNGANTSYTDTITRGWQSVNYRVRAYDTYDAYSAYTTGTAQPVNNNRPPVVTCDTPAGSDLGTRTAGFSVGYSVTDPDGDAVTVTEDIDGAAKRTFPAESGTAYTFELTGETFMKLLNGSHALAITAGDGNAAAVHRLTFTKEVTAATITLAEPMEADDKISICVLSVAGDIPADADFTVEVTNNANDDTPVWEDCTIEVKNGGNHIFTNESASNGFAFNFRVSVERGASGKGGYISGIQGGFQ